MQHFTETHRKTSNFDISTCHFCFMQKIIYYSKRNSPRFSLPKFCRCSIYVITIVNFTNRAVQNLFNFPQRSSMDFSKVTNYTFWNKPQNRKMVSCINLQRSITEKQIFSLVFDKSFRTLLKSGWKSYHSWWF